MKKAVCSGYYGFDNFGDEAVLKVLVEGFSTKYNLTVLSANPSKTSALYDVKSIYSFNYSEVLKEIIASDVFISGGGSLLQDTTSFKSLLYYLLLIYFAILYRKEVIIFAQGLGPLNSFFSKFLVKNALKQCTKITVRDIKSKKLLDTWGINSTLVCDPVFSIPIADSPKDSKIGIQLRTCRNLSDKFLTDLATAINKHFADKSIVLYSLQDSLDLNICKDFASKLKVKNVTIKENLTIDEVIKEISSLEYLIAMRFHAALIGLKSGVKVLPIAYDPKVENLAINCGIEFLNPYEQNNIETILGTLKSFDITEVTQKLNNIKFDFKIFDI